MDTEIFAAYAGSCLFCCCSPFNDLSKIMWAYHDLYSETVLPSGLYWVSVIIFYLDMLSENNQKKTDLDLVWQ